MPAFGVLPCSRRAYLREGLSLGKGAWRDLDFSGGDVGATVARRHSPPLLGAVRSPIRSPRVLRALVDPIAAS